MEPYSRFLSSITKTGGYEKSEDGDFPATGGSLFFFFFFCGAMCVRVAAYDLLALVV